jgi:hypothetical protein
MKGFVVLPRRWVVERTFSWFGRNRRLAKDFENLTETLATFVTLASIQLALRRTFAGAPCNDRDAPKAATSPLGEPSVGFRPCTVIWQHRGIECPDRYGSSSGGV